MGHGLYQNDTMLTVGQSAWHGLGTVLKDAPTVDEAIKIAGLDWEVKAVQNYCQIGRGRVATPSQSILRIARKDVMDADGNPEQTHILGSVGPAVVPYQNRQAFGFFDRWLESGKVSIETAGSLFGGRRVWVLAKITSDPIVVSGDDIVNKYILLAHAHDGTLAIRAGLTPVRVVCHNTLSAALGLDRKTGKPTHKKEGIFRVLHRKGAIEQLENVADAIDEMDGRLNAVGEVYRKLAATNVPNEAAVDEFIGQVYGERKAGAKTGKPGKSFRTEAIKELFEGAGLGSDLAGSKGTYWGLYNALTEFTQHRAGRTAESRSDSVAFGEAAKVNRKGLDAAFIMANKAYTIESVMGEFSDAGSIADASHPNADLAA